MISFLPSIFPDELFYSWVVRYHKYSGNCSPGTTMQELFNKKRGGLNIYLPINIEFLIEQIPNNSVMTSEDIIDNHTIFPYLRIFMTQEEIKRTIESIKHGTEYSKNKDKTVINAQNIFDINVFKICCACYKEDKSIFGEAYIHRSHQIPGSLICMKHMQRFVNFKIPRNLSESEFIDINQYKIDFKNDDKEITPEIINISNDMNYLLNLNSKSLNFNIISSKYDALLKKYLYKCKSIINRSKVIEDLVKYYSKNFLESLNAIKTDKESTKWIKYVTKDVNKRVSPVRHLLLMRFLAGSAEEFVNYIGSGNPFGEGPWPCLNPVANHYKKMMIKNCSITKYSKKVIAVFKCNDCGFTYTRKLKSDIYELYTIREYGHVWEEKLKQLLRQNKTKNRIAKLMKCDHNTVKLYKQKLETHIENKPCANNKLLAYKQKIHNYIINNKSQSRVEISKTLHKEYYYILNKDRNWLQSILPNKLSTSSYGNCKNWNEEDDKLLISVKKAIKDILEDSKLTMVTISSISKRCKNWSIRKKTYFNKLPKTKQLIMDNLETRENFKRRKLKKCIELLIVNKEKVNKTNILRRVNVTKDYEKYESFIQECIIELSEKNAYSV